ncbi:MAG TPA: MBOAT family O-acyltransferase [Trichormus sp.]
MLFNSTKFLFFFLPVAYLVFWCLRTKQQRYIWLTITGYVFYSAWNYKFCALMAFSTIVSFLAGLGFLRFDSGLARRLCLVLPITIDLLLLGFFKYANFGAQTVNAVSDVLGLHVSLPAIDVILPIGISFYTFHTISYIVDCYRKTITPTKNFFEFSCYVSLFSQLVAGPIVRFRQIESDLENIDRKGPFDGLNIGFSFFAIGIIEKVLIADTIAGAIDRPLAAYHTLSTAGAWLCMLGYTYQLFFDFVGYSDMAVGLGYLFGLRIPQNFNSPYKAIDIADFWRRWHISLSSCLRDYIYIPLGGNRFGKFGQYRNLLLTMLIGGLWHGAAWTFVFWGAYHGVLLALNKFFEDHVKRVPLLLRCASTFLLVLIGWVFFRSTSFVMASELLQKMFVPQSGTTDIPAVFGLASVLIIAAFLSHVAPNSWELKHEWKPAPTFALAAGFSFAMMLMMVGIESPFLYFQF